MENPFFLFWNGYDEKDESVVYSHLISQYFLLQTAQYHCVLGRWKEQMNLWMEWKNNSKGSETKVETEGCEEAKKKHFKGYALTISSSTALMPSLWECSESSYGPGI